MSNRTNTTNPTTAASAAKHTKNSGNKRAKKGAYTLITSNFNGILILDGRSLLEKKSILDRVIIAFNSINNEFKIQPIRDIQDKLSKCTSDLDLENFEKDLSTWICNLVFGLFDKKHIGLGMVRPLNFSNDGVFYNLVETSEPLKITLKQHSRRNKVPDVITWVDLSNESKGVAMMIPGLDIIEDIAVQYMILRNILDRSRIYKICNADMLKNTEPEVVDDKSKDIPFDFETL